jgi:hypothetical protein
VSARSGRSALAVRDGGTMLVPADLLRMTQRRARQPVVAALWRVAFGREGVASAVER